MPVLNENRQYQRILHSDESEATLKSRGFVSLFSSNVSAVATDKNNLIIRFHNGSLYSYKDKADDYLRLIGAASAGKWVWRFLRRPNAQYAKIGTLPLAEDTAETDEEIVQPRIATYKVEAIVPTPLEIMKGVLPQIKISPLALITATNNSFTSNILTGLLVGVL